MIKIVFEHSEECLELFSLQRTFFNKLLHLVFEFEEKKRTMVTLLQTQSGGGRMSNNASVNQSLFAFITAS